MNKQRVHLAILIVLVAVAVSAYFVHERSTAKRASTQTDSGVTGQVQPSDTVGTPYPVFDVQKAKIGMRVGDFTLAQITGEGQNKSYVFIGTTTVTGTYYLTGIDGPFFQTDKPVNDSDRTVTIPKYDFEFTNGDTLDSVLHDGEHVTIRITGYEYNGEIMASDGVSDRTTFVSIVK